MKKNSKMMTIFDTLFIMVLCFATLLSAMIMKGKSVGAMNYSINWLSFGLTIDITSLYGIC